MRQGDEVIAAGELVHTSTRVVLWFDPLGYDAYRPHCFFDPSQRGPSSAPDRIARYGSFRGALAGDIAKRVRTTGWTLPDLQRTVTQVVLHFDACGTSKRCFEVLHDIRGLSCHFLLDLDGTVYQTLDLKERAWHAAEANDKSIGIEIANVGAYSSEEPLAAWYQRDRKGLRLSLPDPSLAGHLAEGFVGRPSRSRLFEGTINKRSLYQYDYTEEQYRALESLLVALCRTFPLIRPDVPREPDGAIRTSAFESPDELFAFRGLIGHYHVTTAKVDPGPAFDWGRILRALKEAGLTTTSDSPRASS